MIYSIVFKYYMFNMRRKMYFSALCRLNASFFFIEIVLCLIFLVEILCVIFIFDIINQEEVHD